MKNLPEKIYLNLGFQPDEDTDFNDLSEVTHSTRPIFRGDIEYIAKDMAVELAMDFAEYVTIKKFGHEMNRTYKKKLFKEFINSRNK